MKTTLLIAASLATLAGCSAAVRSPEMYRDDTSKVLESKQGEIRACYDAVLKGTPGVSGKVTVNFDVETEGGKIQNVTVDKANTTAPDAVGDCVKKSIEGLAISPPDARLGKATYVYEFSAPPPPAPAAPPAKS
jgi:hypothetical protein